MHELSIVQSFVAMADKAAQDNHARQVRFVTLEIGKLTGVVPRYVQSYYPDVCEGTLLEGSELKNEEKDALVFCRECGHSYDPLAHESGCPECGSDNSEILEGKSLILKEIGFV